MHALGGNLFNLVAAHWQFDAYFSAGTRKSLDVIVESKEDTPGGRYDVEYDVALRHRRIDDRDLGLPCWHVPSLEEGNAFSRHRIVPHCLADRHHHPTLGTGIPRLPGPLVRSKSFPGRTLCSSNRETPIILRSTAAPLKACDRPACQCG